MTERYSINIDNTTVRHTPTVEKPQLDTEHQTGAAAKRLFVCMVDGIDNENDKCDNINTVEDVESLLSYENTRRSGRTEQDASGVLCAFDGVFYVFSGATASVGTRRVAYAPSEQRGRRGRRYARDRVTVAHPPTPTGKSPRATEEHATQSPNNEPPPRKPTTSPSPQSDVTVDKRPCRRRLRLLRVNIRRARRQTGGQRQNKCTGGFISRA